MWRIPFFPRALRVGIQGWCRVAWESAVPISQAPWGLKDKSIRQRRNTSQKRDFHFHLPLKKNSFRDWGLQRVRVAASRHDIMYYHALLRCQRRPWGCLRVYIHSATCVLLALYQSDCTSSSTWWALLPLCAIDCTLTQPSRLLVSSSPSHSDS